VTGTYQEVLDETRQQLAHVHGELTAVRDQLASSLAAEAQLRREVEAYRLEATVAASELTHAQRGAAEREESTRRRIAELEDQLSEARRRQELAESERAAVIAALRRRARRRVLQTP